MKAKKLLLIFIVLFQYQVDSYCQSIGDIRRNKVMKLCSELSRGNRLICNFKKVERKKRRFYRIVNNKELEYILLNESLSLKVYAFKAAYKKRVKLTEASFVAIDRDKNSQIELCGGTGRRTLIDHFLILIGDHAGDYFEELRVKLKGLKGAYTDESLQNSR